ncbi:MAG TPA: hypothetical protein VF989_17255 [Polyangiaceae bacterium]
MADFEPFLRDAPLGNYLVWATFNAGDTSANPFDRLPDKHAQIRTVLALGSSDEALILLAWSHADCGAPPLHRPTVADAEMCVSYRPYPAPDAPWGFTSPLAPNPWGLDPQPEVVMRQLAGTGLLLPFRVVRA